jgi:hypothetical protein
MRLEGLDQLKKNPLHRDSNPRPSGLQHSASTNYATACPTSALIRLNCCFYICFNLVQGTLNFPICLSMGNCSFPFMISLTRHFPHIYAITEILMCLPIDAMFSNWICLPNVSTCSVHPDNTFSDITNRLTPVSDTRYICMEVGIELIKTSVTHWELQREERCGLT